MNAARYAFALILPLAFTGCLTSEDPSPGPTALAPQSTSLSWRQVSIDVKPGVCPNRIDSRSNEVLSFAILGAPDFDPRDVDIPRVQFRVFGQLVTPLAPFRSRVADIVSPAPADDPCGCGGHGPDGYPDLVLTYRSQVFAGALSYLDRDDEVEITLNGHLLDGSLFTGSDCLVGSGNPQGPPYDYAIKFEQGRAKVWFGGDDRAEFGPRNVGAGQSVLITRDILLGSFALEFDRYFDYSENPEGKGHEVKLVLDIRDVKGGILDRVTVDVSASFSGGWVTWDGIDLPVAENTELIFTAYVADGFTNNLSNGILQDFDDGYPDGSRYTGHELRTSDLESWSNWYGPTPGDDCRFWLQGRLMHGAGGPSASGTSRRSAGQPE